MDVRIVSNCDDAVYKPLYGELVLQISNGVNKIGPFVSKKCHIFNVGLNERYEALSSVPKYDFIEIIDCEYNSKYIYFVSCNDIKPKGRMSVSVYKYSIVTGKSDIIYTFNDEYSDYVKEKRMKIFILDENYILVQTEYLRKDDYDNDLGYTDISVMLVDIKEETSQEILDNVIAHSGIDTVIPIRRNICLVKTGYSFMTDSRYDSIKPEERPTEYLAFININQFISDILLNKKQLHYEQIEKFDKDVTYPYVRLDDDYITYSKVNVAEHTETIVYYSLGDKSVRTFLNKQVFRASDLKSTALIDGEVHYCSKTADGCIFTEADNPKKEHRITGCNILKIIHGIIITERIVPKGFIKKPYTVVELFKGFSSEPVIREKGTVADVLCTDKDNIFIFTRNDRQ